MAKQGGSTANKTGSQLETFVENRLRREDYTYVVNTKFLASMKALTQPLYYSQICVGKTIYGTSHKCDFIIFHPSKHPKGLIIEAKWQQGGGTVDEKYPYLVENLKHSQYDSIIIIDGGGYRKGALQWLKEQKGGRLKYVFSMAEFTKWANKENI